VSSVLSAVAPAQGADAAHCTAAVPSCCCGSPSVAVPGHGSHCLSVFLRCSLALRGLFLFTRRCADQEKGSAEESSTAWVGLGSPLTSRADVEIAVSEKSVPMPREKCAGAFRFLCNINFQQRLAVSFLARPGLQQPLSACVPKGIPGLSASCSAQPDPSAEGESWWSAGPRQEDVPAGASAGRSRAQVLSALTNAVSIFVRPVSAVRGTGLLRAFD